MKDFFLHHQQEEEEEEEEEERRRLVVWLLFPVADLVSIFRSVLGSSVSF
jgi:hypothetical protein